MIKSPAALARKRAYDKNYRLANHERIRTREREYYKKNATTILERQAEYRSGHKEAEAKRFKRYYAAHQDARVRSSRRWRAENRERHRAYQCEYAKAHEAEQLVHEVNVIVHALALSKFKWATFDLS